MKNAKQTQLIKKFHTLLGRHALNADVKAEILASFDVTSSKDLSIKQLKEICGYIEKTNRTKEDSHDKWRKRVMASIGSCLRAMGESESPEKIKKTACRATGYSTFNKIPLDRLKSIYNAFKNRKNDIENINRITTHNPAINTNNKYLS